MLSHLSRTTVVAAGLMLASCTVLNPTFGEEESSTGSETSDSGVTLSSSSGGSSGSTVSDSLSSTTLPSSTSGDETWSTSNADSSESTDTASFIEPTGGACGPLPDGVLGHCSECSVIAQDCPKGEACRAWADDGGSTWNATRCSSVPEDPDQDRDPCVVEDSPTSGIDSCDAGLMCWDVNSGTLEGTCISYCTGTPQAPICEDPDRICSISSDGVLALCLEECDPLVVDCDEGSVCAPASGDAFVCVPEETSPCPAGMLEVPAMEIAACVDGDPCCTPYCDLSEDLPCAEPGMECVPFFTEPTLAYENVGVCITAM